MQGAVSGTFFGTGITEMQTGLFRSALILGLLSAVGPFAIDMYLPAMPMIAADLQGTIPQTQATVTSFFLAFGIAQLFYGPWSDQVGRKLPLFTGLTLFLVASIGCALATSIEWLIALRVLQGLGASVVMVLPRAIIRDQHTGTDATRLMALVMLVVSVSPMLAPLAGSGLLAVWGWRSIFWAIAVASMLSLTMVALLQPETLAPQHRVRVDAKALTRGARTLLTSPRFVGLTLIGACGIGGFFIFVNTAAFVYANQYGLTPTQFSLAFAANAVGFFAASQTAAPLGERLGMVNVIRYGTVGYAICAVALMLLVMSGISGLFVLIVGLCLANACFGVVMPSAMVLSLDDHGDIAGLASSLGGTLQMIVAGLIAFASGQFFDGTALPMVSAIAICAVMATLLAMLVLRPNPVAV